MQELIPFCYYFKNLSLQYLLRLCFGDNPIMLAPEIEVAAEWCASFLNGLLEDCLF